MISPEELEGFLLEPHEWFDYAIPPIAETILRNHLKNPSGSMALGYLPEEGFFILGVSQKPFVVWAEWEDSDFDKPVDA